MSVWFDLRINRGLIGTVEIRRVEDLNISDPAAVADVVSTYEVSRDGVLVGTVRHRYGDRAWRLLASAAHLIAAVDEAVCDCGHEGLDLMFHLHPCPIAVLRDTAREKSANNG
jgi:hypothetical protein